MRKVIIPAAVFLVVALLLVGCGSESDIPTDPSIPQGAIVPASDSFIQDTLAYEDFLEEPILSNYYVYLPPDYDPDLADGYPVLYMLNGFSKDENYFVGIFSATDAANLLLSDGSMEPMIIVMPSGFNAFGGSFYTNSLHPHVGRAEDHILWVVDQVDAAYNTIDDPSGRAIAGHSMGGFGAVSIAMHSDLFGYVGSMAGPLVLSGVKPSTDPTFVNALFAEAGYDTVLEQNADGDSALFVNLLTQSFMNQNTYAAFTFAMSAAFGPPVDTLNLLPMGTIIPTFGIYVPILIDGTEDETFWSTFWDAADPLQRLLNPGDPTERARLSNAKLYFDVGQDDEIGMADMQAGFLQALAAVGITPDTSTVFEPIDDAIWGTIPADHTQQTFERVIKLLVWQSEKFREVL